MKVPTTASPPVLEGELLPKPIAVGDRLDNAGFVLAAKPSTRVQGDTIVLAMWHLQFVTWVVKSDGEAYWGHYFTNTDLKGSLADFEARG